MAEDPKWDGTPALGVILARMAELYARVVQVELAQQKKNADRVAAMFTESPSK